MSDYETGAALIISGQQARCAFCGKGAVAREVAHLTRVPIDGGTAGDGRGCGARFVAVTSDYKGSDHQNAAQAMRPDLPWRDFREVWRGRERRFGR